MNHKKEQVRRFYEVIWNQYDKGAIPDVFHESFLFRGSLGEEKQGHSGFTDYLDMVHSALADYKCIINEMVAEGEKVFAKMQFTGMHRGEFMGFLPTGQRITWDGVALFYFNAAKISEILILGDLKSLEEQLIENQT